MSDAVIKVENVYKEYRLGIVGYGTLREDLQSWWAKIRGKEDPNSLIGEDYKDGANTSHILALNDVSFDVKKGEILGIIGKNGAGKSTLLKILSRITAPTSGQIMVKGRVGSLLEVGTGFHPELTGRENIYLNGAILGMSRKEVDEKFQKILDFSGIKRFIDTPVKRYSSGMYVRLAFSVAVHLDPEILIIDEVLAVGDVEFQKKCLDKIKAVVNDGLTVLFVSHYMAAVKSIATRVVYFEDGRVKSIGNTDDIIYEYIKLNIDENNDRTNWINKDKSSNAEIESFDIKSMKMVDSKGREKNRFLSNEKIIFEICLFVNEPDKNQLLCFEVFKEIDMIFRFPFFLNEKIKVTNSNYKLKIEIPNNLFNQGKYTISISGSLYNIKPCFGYERIFNFDIDFVVPPGFISMDKHPGFIFPLLKYEIEEEK